jgi:RHS repeat-associated protein
MSFEYDVEGRLAHAYQTATPAEGGTYAYDSRWRLASRTVSHASPASSTTILYLHDLDDRIIAETDTSGNTLREYIWLGDTPLAVVDNAPTSPAIFYVHTDHLMRPLLMTDASAALAWSAAYEPFGTVASVTVISSSIDLRFPGQWFQLENGLHYNWHRHYDASTGRYVQPDPLGQRIAARPLASSTIPARAGEFPQFTLPKVPLPEIAGQFETPLFKGEQSSLYAYAQQSAPLSRADETGLQAQVLVGVCVRFPQVCAAPIAAAIAAGAKACLRVIGSSGGGGGGGGGGDDQHRRCVAAANGSEDEWLSFCRSIGRNVINNVVGGGRARAACFNHTFESPQNKTNWCENQFGPQ